MRRLPLGLKLTLLSTLGGVRLSRARLRGLASLWRKSSLGQYSAAFISPYLKLSYASLGLRVVLADNNEAALKDAAAELGAIVGPANVMAIKTDVSNLEEVQKRRQLI